MTVAVTDALAAAERVIALIHPECERIKVAGSIRRGKAEVKDAELVVIPRAGLWPLVDQLVAQHTVSKAIYSDGKTRWGKKYRGVLIDGVKVEIFTADEANWGYQFWLRTGPGPANNHVMKWRSFTQKTATWYARDGYIHDSATDERLIIADERAMFAVLGTDYLEPHERTLERYQQVFRRGHKWGDVSNLPRADNPTSVPVMFSDATESPHLSVQPLQSAATEAAHRAYIEGAWARAEMLPHIRRNMARREALTKCHRARNTLLASVAAGIDIPPRIMMYWAHQHYIAAHSECAPPSVNEARDLAGF